MIEWIDVKNGLPNVNTHQYEYEEIGVIVYIKGETRTNYRIYERACRRNKVVYRWKYPWGRVSDEEITHWAYLPEPPEEITP